MKTIAERIKYIRKYYDLTQREFGERINVKRNTVATYEMGRSTPSDSAIALICREFDVNEEWLRTGEGDWRIEVEKNDKLSLWVDNVLKDKSDSLKKRLLTVLSILDENDWRFLEQLEQKARELIFSETGNKQNHTAENREKNNLQVFQGQNLESDKANTDVQSDSNKPHTHKVWAAARSVNHTPPATIEMTDEELQKLYDAPGVECEEDL